LGFVESSTLPILYSCAGALVFPSIYEGFGLPALEARQSGTRVITSQHSAMAEYANEYDLLVDPLEVDSLKEAMEAVVERVLEDNGQPLQCVGSGLSWQKTALLTSEVYKKC
jgi:alpha-1,3-rhamnosyl/mannosyltransferase